MTLERWWIPASELLTMPYLGYFRQPGGEKCRAPWIDDGGLDPDVLIDSELFRGDDVEPATDFLFIPPDVCASSDLTDAYLRQHGWNWPAEGPEPVATAAWTARTATNVHFWINRRGLLAHLGRFPTRDAETSQWLGSPLWAAFLIVCSGFGPDSRAWKIFSYETPELWREPLEYLSEQRPLLAGDANSASRIMDEHFKAQQRQAIHRPLVRHYEIPREGGPGSDTDNTRQ